MLLQSETKIEPDLRLEPGNNLNIRAGSIALAEIKQECYKEAAGCNINY